MRRRHTFGWWVVRAAVVAWFASAIAAECADVRMSVLRSGRQPSFVLALLIALPSALSILGSVVAPVWMTARYPVTRKRIAGAMTAHLLVASLTAFTFVLVRVAQRAFFATVPRDFAADRAPSAVLAMLTTYLLVATLAHAVEYARRYQQRQTAELRLQREVGDAELQRTAAELRMLKMQLNPHFLSSSLNVVALLISSAPETAQRMVVELATLLRNAMHSVATQEVALDEELAGLAPYVQIQQLCRAGALTVEWQVDDEARDALVPHMLLQPIVENAIGSGIDNADGRRTLRVSATRAHEWLEITVTADGVATDAEPGTARELGLVNVNARLAQLYGTAYHIAVRSEEGRTITVVRVPWHEEPIDPRVQAPPVRARATAAYDSSSVPPPGRRLLQTELALSGACFGLFWLAGYDLRHGEALASGVRRHQELALGMSGMHGALMAGVLLATFRLTHARPISLRRDRRAWPAHAVLALAFGIALAIEKRLQHQAMGLADDPWSAIMLVLVLAPGMYVIYASAAHVVEYVRRAAWTHAAELRLQVALGQAELRRTTAELRMLKMQLNPHFLFNSLNALSLLIATTPVAARRMVVGLADLLGRAMHSVGIQEVALEEELAGLVPFVDIEQIRLGGHLMVAWEVAGDVRNALVPHMLLQPLVENAIKHGLVPAGGRGSLRVGAVRDGEWLLLTVADDGVGLAPKSTRAQGIGGVGSANVEARLHQLYGTRYSFVLQSAEGGGTLASVRLPWHELPIGPAALQ